MYESDIAAAEQETSIRGADLIVEHSDQLERVWEDPDAYEAQANAARVDLFELDDRPQWMRDLGMVDEDIPVEDDTIDTEEPDGAALLPMCVHCHARPIKHPGPGWCSACYEYQRTHNGKLRPPRLTKAKRAN